MWLTFNVIKKSFTFSENKLEIFLLLKSLKILKRYIKSILYTLCGYKITEIFHELCQIHNHYQTAQGNTEKSKSN